MAHPDAASLEVFASVLSARGVGRLDKALIDTKKALSVGVNVYELHDPGVVMISATLSDDQSIDEVKKIILDTVAGLASERPTKEEVDRAKTSITQRMAASLDSSADRRFPYCCFSASKSLLS